MTLVEVLIGAALFSIVAGSAYVLYIAMIDTLNKGELKADLQQNARVGLAKMTQEIRMAGYDPPVGDPPMAVIPQIILPPKAPIRTATAQCFSFIADVSGDVSGTGVADQITYNFDSSKNTLRRRQDNWSGPPKYEFAGGSFQPLAGSVDLLTFTYYDANNQVLPMEDWTSTHACPPDPKAKLEKRKQLTYEQMRQIRRVAITLKTLGSRPGIYPDSFTLTSDVHLRNL
jgi:Tfp pilus assembly protein PilW